MNQKKRLPLHRFSGETANKNENQKAVNLKNIKTEIR